ncbi:hypothetical protein SGRIM119S_00129 [Streptomyces griseorubiginosus]
MPLVAEAESAVAGQRRIGGDSGRSAAGATTEPFAPGDRIITEKACRSLLTQVWRGILPDQVAGWRLRLVENIGYRLRLP